MNLMNATDIFLKRKNELEEEYKSLVQTPNSPIRCCRLKTPPPSPPHQQTLRGYWQRSRGCGVAGPVETGNNLMNLGVKKFIIA